MCDPAALLLQEPGGPGVPDDAATKCQISPSAQVPERMCERELLSDPNKTCNVNRK